MDIYTDENKKYCFEREDRCFDCPEVNSKISCGVYFEAHKLIATKQLEEERKGIKER